MVTLPVPFAVIEAADLGENALTLSVDNDFYQGWLEEHYLPMLYAQGSGADIQKPLAVVVMGGLITSTLLTLIVIPAVYALVKQIPMSNRR